jgi:outer membrane protein TolC
MVLLRRSMLLLLLAGLFPAFASAQTAPQSLTLPEFYKRVQAYYPKLQAEAASVDLALAKKIQALAGFLPYVKGSVGVTRGDDPVDVFGALLRQEKFSSANFEIPTLNTPRPYNNYTYMVQAEVPLFDAFQTIARVRAARYGIAASRYRYKSVEMEAVLVSADAYLRALAVEQLLQAVTEVSDAAQKDIEQAQSLKEKGMVLGADYYAARVSYDRFVMLKNELSQERQAVMILLNVLMGEDPLQPLKLTGELKASSVQTRELRQWFTAAQEFRPDLLAMEADLKAQEQELAREKNSNLPVIKFSANAREDKLHPFAGGGDNYTLGLTGEVPIFDFGYSGRIKAASAQLKNLEKQLVLFKDNITTDLAAEYSRRMSLQSNLTIVEQMVKDAQEAVNLTLPLYQEGRKSIIDVMDIRNAYLASAQTYYELLSQSSASWSRMLFLSGELEEESLEDLVK